MSAARCVAMLERLRTQAGQTASEYLGMLLVVSAVIAALATTQVGTLIEGHMQELICKIAGTECHVVEPPPLGQCVVSEASDKLTLNGEFNVRFVKIKLEGGVEYVRQKRADGTVAITVKLPTSGGVGPPLAKALGVANLDGTIKVGSTPQVTFILPGDKAANTFSTQIKDSAIAIAAGPIGSRLLGKRVHVDVPPVESVAYELTAGANASIGVDTPGGYGEGSLELGQAVGIKKNLTSGKPNSGDLTAYYKVSGTASGEGGLLVGEGFGGTLAGDMMLAVTFDSGGKPKTLSLIASGSYEGKLQLNGKYKDLKTALKAVDALGFKANAGAGKKGQVQIDLPLENPAVRDSLLGFLTGVDPATGQPVDKGTAGAQVWSAIEQNAKVQVRTYDTASSSTGADVDLGVGGGGINYDTTSAELTGAQDYVPGQGFVPSEVCRK